MTFDQETTDSPPGTKKGARKKKSAAKKTKASSAKQDAKPDNVVELPQSGRKQTLIPGTEPPYHEEVDAAATHYNAKRISFNDAALEKKSSKATLLAIMKKHDVSAYRFRDCGKGWIARLKPGKDNVEVEEYSADDDDIRDDKPEGDLFDDGGGDAA